MAEVAFPSEIELTAMTIEPWFPGQVALRSPFTGFVQVLNRGYPSWRGVADISPAAAADVGKVIEAFLASLKGQENWTDLPLNRPTIASGTTSTVASIVNNTDGTVSHTLAADVGAVAGDWLTSGTRVFTVRAVSGLTLTLDPQLALAVGDTISAATTIRARARAPDVGPTRRTPNQWGPWRFTWEEAF